MAANSSRVQQQHHHQQQQQQQQQPHQQQSNFGLPPPPRMISDPSTLVNPYHMMQSSLANNGSNNTRPQNNNSNSYLPDLQLPGIPKPNLPQNDGACDELLTTEVKYIRIIVTYSLYVIRKLIDVLKISFSPIKMIKKRTVLHFLLLHFLVNLFHWILFL